MSIEIHCPQCSKLIRAPATAGGKSGKCPYCDHSVYIPMPPEESGEIALTPIDETEERQAEALRQESIKYAAAVDKDGPSERGSAVGRGGAAMSARSTASPEEVVEVGSEVERFILAMRDSKLDQAEVVVTKLKRVGARARDHVEGMLMDEMPPPIKDLPPPLMKGFLKTLLARLR